MVVKLVCGHGTSDGTREAERDISMAKCSCGRSPTGLCVGWHALTKEDYEKKKKQYDELSEKDKKTIFHTRAIDGIGE